MAERMHALRTPSRARGRATKHDEGGAAPTGLDRASRDILLRFVRGTLPPAPHVLAAAHRGLTDPRLVARLVEAHRRGAPLGRNVDRKIQDPLAVVADPAFDFSASSSADETRELTIVAQKLDIAMKSTREGHERLAAIREDQSGTGWVSECAESVGEVAAAGWAVARGKKRAAHADWSVSLPPLSMWDVVAENISHALDALRSGSTGTARHALVVATSGFERCYRRFIEYKERTEAGASGMATTLHVVQTTCESIVADLAAAQFAGVGLLAVALAAAAAGVAGGAAVALDGIAQQGVEHHIGLRRDYELMRLLGDAGEAAISNFVSSLVSGALAKPFEKVVGNILKYHVPPELWVEVMGDAERLTAAHAMAHFTHWKSLVELCGTEAATLLSGTVDGVLALYRARRRGDVNVPTIMETLEQDLLANGLAQIFVSALMRRRAAQG